MAEQPAITETPLLLYSWVCPYVHRVTLSLGHKKQSIPRIDIDLQNKPEWLPKYSPLGKVPAITYTEGGEQQVLYESIPLSFWVDEFFGDKGPALLPSSPALRTKARIIINRYDANVGTFYALLRTRDKEEFDVALGKFQDELKWVEHSIHPTGPFLLGAEPGLVDAIVAPWLLRAPVLKHYRNVDILSGHTRLQAFVEAYKALPEVQATFTTPSGNGYEAWIAAGIEGYAKYGGEPLDFSA